MHMYAIPASLCWKKEMNFCPSGFIEFD
jgi:hypothetical protein